MSLRLEFLGGFRALVGQKLAGRTLTARHQQIVAYLAINRPAGVPRQRLAGLLWPDSTDAQALTNLRRELHHLRQVLPEIGAAIEIDSRALVWRADWRGTIDLDEFRRAAEDGLRGRRERLEAAAGLYRGDLLPDCDEEWASAERDRVRDLAVRVLTKLVSLFEADRAFAPAIDAAQRLLRIDPVDEGAWRSLIRCHARRGERAVALHDYQRCVAALKQHVGAPPDAATQLVYREILELDEADAAIAPSPKPITYPLVGRKDEFAALRRAWHAAEAGSAHLALVRGEAGIGKTRLAEELAAWAAGNGIRTATTRCYAGEGRLAYAPITAWLQSKTLQPSLDALDAARLGEIARIHPDLVASRPDAALPASQLETWQRPRFFEALTRVFHGAAPVLLVLDDLQWCDAESLEWLHFLLRSLSGFRCLVVGTVRAEEAADNAALGVLLRNLEREDRVTVIDLGPLDETATARLAEEAAGSTLDEAARARAFRQTEGHPLHIVERARMTASADDPADAVVPPRVQAIVVARLVQLSPEARDTAELAAVIGRDFSFDVLSHASDLDEQVVVRVLDELWRRQIVRAQEADRWDFSHDRIREVAYANVGPARRRLLHRRVAQALQQTAGRDLDRLAASIATHYEHAGLHARAVELFERAAHEAARVSAHEEAIRCLTLALSLLTQGVAGGDHDERELGLRGALSASLSAARGYAAVETEENLERVAALELALHGSVPVRWLWALWSNRFVLGDFGAARALAERALAFTETDPSCRCEAHHALAGTLTSMGELEEARRHFEIAISVYDDEGRPQYSALGPDLGVFGHCWYAHVLCMLGSPDEALAHADTAIALATRLDHPFSLAVAHAYAALTHQLRGDPARIRESTRALRTLCERHGFSYYGEWALIFEGWAAGGDGHFADGIALIEAGIDGLAAQRAQTRRPYYLALLAETLIRAGRTADALDRLDAGIAAAESTLDTWWLAELYRLKSEIAPAGEAGPLLDRALAIARSQGNRALEARASASLARTLPRTLHERSLT
jgi:DNA-binding SARP family transcriptional activator